MLSLFYVSLLLAAGSNASPCRLQSGNSSSSLTTGGDGQGSAATDQDQNQKLHILPLPYSQGSQTSSITSASSPGPSLAASGASGSSGSSGSSGNSGNSGNSGTSVTSGSLTPASGSCPPGFLNTVFNTNAGQSAGFPSTTWKSLTENGIDNWSALTLAAQKTFCALCSNETFASSWLFPSDPGQASRLRPIRRSSSPARRCFQQSSDTYRHGPHLHKSGCSDANKQSATISRTLQRAGLLLRRSDTYRRRRSLRLRSESSLRYTAP